jgi:hypothetical protein
MHGWRVAEWQIGTPDGSCKEDITGNAEFMPDKCHMTGSMPRHVPYGKGEGPKRHGIPLGQLVLGGGRIFDLNAPS